MIYYRQLSLGLSRQLTMTLRLKMKLNKACDLIKGKEVPRMPRLFCSLFVRAEKSTFNLQDEVTMNKSSPMCI